MSQTKGSSLRDCVLFKLRNFCWCRLLSFLVGHQNAWLRHCISPGDNKFSCRGTIIDHYRTTGLLITRGFDSIPTYFSRKWLSYFERVSLKHRCMINDRDKCKVHVIFVYKLNNLPDNGHIVLQRFRAITNTTIISTPVVCWGGLLLNCNHVDTRGLGLSIDSK